MDNNAETIVESEKAPKAEQDLTWADVRQVLKDEAIHLDSLREKQRLHVLERMPRAFEGSTSVAPQSKTSPAERFGLALSGGGIRSATFSLGVIQALAQRRRIASIDYISTVSGGGYIGAWLSACIYRARLGGSTDPVHDVESRITPQSIRHAPEEAAEVRFLRAYSNYLTPRLGMFSGDTLAALSGFLRNLSLNLVLGILSGLFVLGIVHALIALAVANYSRVNGEVQLLGFSTLYALWFALVALSLLLTFQSHDVRALEDWHKGSKTKIVNRLQGVPSRVVVFLLGWALFLSSIWICFNAKDPGALEIGLVLLTAIVAIGFGAICSYVLLHLRPPEEGSKFRAKLILDLIRSSAQKAFDDSRNELLRYVIAIAACAAVTYLAAIIGFSLRPTEFDTGSAVQVIALGPTVGVVFLWLLFVVWTGVLGNMYSEFTREWLNRFLGDLSGFAALWMVVSALVVHARPIWYWTVANLHNAIQQSPLRALVGAVAVSSISAIAWKFRKRRVPSAEAEGETKRPVTMIMCWVFVSAFIFMLTVVFQDAFLFAVRGDSKVISGYSYSEILDNQIANLASALSARPARWLDPKSWLLYSPAFTVVVLIGLLAAFSFRFVDVNTFSLQNLYRNRLVRCYLGAAHGAGRLPNPYAGFDPADDFAFNELADQRPYLLVNAALNITQGQDLAWQQRKAAAFVFSPRWCGYWLAPTEMSEVATSDPNRGGYVQTDHYVHEAGGFRSVSKGVMVGTAIATSGAAVSSQMGFASRGPLAFVLTLLNLRLGRWLPNTAQKGKVGSRDEERKKASPNYGTYWYLRELLGKTDERSAWIYVSDGGHFENLGIYELVRRRCTRILCVDAGADPKRTFADLGNAVQKCRVDFGVDIRIDLTSLEIDSKGFSRDAFSIGTIDYPATQDGNGFKGELVYVKPSLPSSWEHLPTDILAYRARHPEFPHEATSNQWFSESQFESYRHLGHAIGLRVLSATDGWRGPRNKKPKPISETNEQESVARMDAATRGLP
ncbi:patatin-like phospholipase family protein [Bradyrhizobium sp.]